MSSNFRVKKTINPFILSFIYFFHGFYAIVVFKVVLS